MRVIVPPPSPGYSTVARCRRKRARHASRPRRRHLHPREDTALPSPSPHPCRDRCGACCIAPSITSAIPGMPHGKPAGVRCVQLDDAQRCRIFGHPERPAICASLRPSPDMCGTSRDEALAVLAAMERATAP